MKNTITVTSKGQATILATMRRKLGLDKTGGVLQANFDDSKSQLIISKAVGIKDLSERLSRHIKPGTKPLLKVDEYYQTNRP